MLEIARHSLARQSHTDFEWIVVSPFPYAQAIHVQDPPKRPGDYYSLNKAYNAGFKQAKGELIISLQDGIWFPPSTLAAFWAHYVANPKACVGAIGHQYERLEHGKPEGRTWSDPRARMDQGSFYEINPIDLEFTLCSLPAQAVRDAGGIDSLYDRYAAISEKELCARLDKLGYRFFLDQAIEYRALHHPRLSAEWDARYEAGCLVFQQHLREIDAGTRLVLDELS